MPRTRVASTTIASAVPIPKYWMKLTPLVPNAKNVIDKMTAAMVTMRPVRSSPVATALRVSAPASCSSLMRESRKTSSSMERPKATLNSRIGIAVVTGSA